MIRPAALALAAVLAAPAGFAQPAGLAANRDYQAGLSAMQDRLPDLAISRFKNALAAVGDDASARRLLAIKIGEAEVRAARMENDRAKATHFAESALARLTAEDLVDDESALFWAGQAAVILGRPAGAIEFFARLSNANDSTLRNRSQLARAHLLAAIGRSADASQLLSALAASGDAAVASEAVLLHASLLLDDGKLDEAAALLGNETAETGDSHALLRRYLRARLAQVRGEHEKAASLFRALTDSGAQLSPRIQHAAIVALAESLAASEDDENNGDKSEEASEILIRLIDQHPGTPLLDAAMSRLLALAKTDETLNAYILDRLRLWAAVANPAESAEPAPGNSPGNEDPPALPENTQRAGYALYHYAHYLAEKNDPESNQLASNLLADLQNRYPDHALAPLSRLDTARLQSAAGKNRKALATIEELGASAASPAVKAEAAKLAALLQFKEGNFTAAAESFAQARARLEPAQRDLAGLNAGISLLRAGDVSAVGDLLASLDTEEARQSLQLEQILYRVSQESEDSRPALDRFLSEHPEHPRAAEAQLAYSTELLRFDPARPHAQAEARARLDEVDPAELDDAGALRHLLARLDLARHTDDDSDWNRAIEAAHRFLEARESGTLAPLVRLKLAEAYYMNDEHGKARNEFLKLSEAQEDGLLHEVALLFAAKAALKLGTEKSPAEAADYLRRVIALGGVTANEARLELAQCLIDRDTVRDLPEALSVLAPLISGEAVAGNQIDALILAAKAHRVLGTKENLREAIAIYDRVLARDDLSYELSNRFHWLKGQAYELSGDHESALESYYRVLNRKNLAAGETPSEWRWFTRCGYAAARLLEERERWESALGVWRKLAESGSPRAADAAERFEKLQLERQIWDID